MAPYDSLLTEPEDIAKSINQNGKNAAEKIKNAIADLKDKVDRDPDLQKPKETSSGPYDLAGVWPNAPTKEKPTVHPSIGSDIEKFLKSNKLPTTLGEGKDKIDVGHSIAEQAFGNAENAIEKGGNYLKKTFTVKHPSGGQEIQGGHVFYKIPYGNEGNDRYHSVLRVYQSVA